MNSTEIFQWPTMANLGESILFCCVAVVMIVAALGVLFLRKAAYAAISMVVVMLGLAIIYVMLQAPFLGTVQVVVYTGAIMMLFLFVIMMIGLGASDGYQRQARTAIIVSCICGLAFIILMSTIVLLTQVPQDLSADNKVDPYSNEPVTSLAVTLFQDHWMSMELAGILLITAAVGGMLLTHSDQLGSKVDQHSTVHAKMRAFKEKGRHIGQLPSPGVYAESNAVDLPALDGATLQPVEESIPRVLRVHGLNRQLSQVAPEVARALALTKMGLDSIENVENTANTGIGNSHAWGMPGSQAPTGLHQPQVRVPGGPSDAVEDAKGLAADDAVPAAESSAESATKGEDA